MNVAEQHPAARFDAPDLSLAVQAAVDELLHEGESSNTRVSYGQTLRYLESWFVLHYTTPFQMPVAPAVVLEFIVHHAQRLHGGDLLHGLPPALDEALVRTGVKARPGPLALNTIIHHVAVLSSAHRARNLPNPCQDPRVRELLRTLRRAYAKRGAVPKHKDALTREALEAALDTCDEDLYGLRDSAVLWFGWLTGGRRRCEVAAADLRFLKPAHGRAFTYDLAHSKTNQYGQERPENHKLLVGEAAQALRVWLAAANITEGRIFRSIARSGRIGLSLSADAVNDIVHKRCRLAGLEGDYSAHSLRSGFVTAATRLGTPTAQIMAASGHRSVQSLVGYTQVNDADQRRLAHDLLQAPSTPQPPLSGTSVPHRSSPQRSA